MEIFKPVVGFETFYAVSNLGRVISVARIDAAGKQRKERILTPIITRDGYAKAKFWIGARQSGHFIHRVVYAAFIGPIPAGHEINHLNGVRDDNRPENLDAVTHAQNVVYSRDVLKANYATFGNGRMTRDQILAIHSMAAKGMTQRDIGMSLGFSKASIWNVLNGKTWGHIG